MREPFLNTTEGTASSHLRSAYEAEMARLHVLRVLDSDSADQSMAPEKKAGRNAVLTIAVELLRKERNRYFDALMQSWATHEKINFKDGVPV